MLGDGAGPVGDDDDLFSHGIDSIRIMRLAASWRRAGIKVTFAELAEQPTITAWAALLDGRRRDRSASRAAGLVGSAADGPALASVDGAVEWADADGAGANGADAEPFALAPMQQAYWIGRADDQELGGVSAHYYVELDGSAVDPGRLERAVRGLLAAHDMLRARFLPEGRQQILPESPWPGVAVHDLRDDPAQAARLAALRDQLAGYRLDVERGEVFDVQLSLLPGGQTRVHLNVDMLVCDAHSFRLLLGELAERYTGPDRGHPAGHYSFRRYLAELAAARADAHERDRQYWQKRLPDMPGPPTLPLAVEPWQLRERRPGRRWRRLGPALRSALADASAARQLSLAAVIGTCFAEVLAAWSGKPEFLLNLPLFDREQLHPAVDHVVGDFTNLVVLAVDLSAECSFTEQARRLQARLREDIGHCEYSGLEVLRDIARERPGSPLAAPVVFTSALGMGDLFGEHVRLTLGTPGWISSQTPQVWLDHQVTEDADGLLLNWDVVEELFPAGVVDRMFGAYVGLLERLAENADVWDRAVPPLLSGTDLAERDRVNDTAGPLPAEPLHAGFFRWAARDPDRCAVIEPETAAGDVSGKAGGAGVTFGELAAWALRIAGGLRADGVQPGDLVAVSLPRSAGQIAAVLGVLAAGAAYLPVGTDSPEQRRSALCAAAGVARTITAEVIEAYHRALPLDAPVPVPVDALAYVIYTSGSTGVPKGVEITHVAAANTVNDVTERYQVTAQDRILAVSALDFDLSVFDIFGLLGVGGSVVIVAEADRLEARRWAELIRLNRVTVWNSVPALLDMLLTSADHGDLASLRLAMLSGDWVGITLPGRLTEHAPDCRFVALGGATEASIWSNAFEVTSAQPAWRSIPYGFPLRNQAFRVVDWRGRDCPVWVAGELWIGGTGVARGYRADPDRTAAQFLAAGGRRWYRTGDFGRYWADGTLEFLGRRDRQVKVRGHRIELGEVEVALQALPGVADALVMVVSDNRQLAAAVTPRPGAAPDAAGLRNALTRQLPGHMVPATLTVLDQFPLTGNGKVDRNALAALLDQANASGSADAAREAGDLALPRGEIEPVLARLWSRLLQVPAVGRTDSFFVLGGDSLVATRMVTDVRERFGVAVALREFFAAPTVSKLAALIGTRLTDTTPVEEGVI
jgi:amino acid adenylation domain-containing protein